MSDEYLRRKCKNLIPLPRCKCSTMLLVCRNDPHDEPTISTTELKQILNQAKRMDQDQIAKLIVNKFCYQENLKEYKKKAMCYECIEPFVSTAKDVIEHDYKSETQPNVKFSVGGKCTFCRTKFSARALSALVGEGKKSKSHEIDMNEWIENVKTTIQFVGFTKKLKTILGNLKRSSRDLDQEEGVRVLVQDGDSHQEIMNKWLTDPEEYLSDEYFSDDGGEDVEITPDSFSKKSKPTYSCVAPAKGEIMQDLMKKDPKFRQEHEDLEFIQEMSKTPEGRRKLGIEEAIKVRQSEEEIERDARLARDITKRQGATSRKRLAKSPILEFFGKNILGARPKWASLMNASTSRAPKKQKSKAGIEKYMVQKNKSSGSSDSDGSIELLMPSEETAPKETQTIGDKVDNATIEIFDSDSDGNGNGNGNGDGHGDGDDKRNSVASSSPLSSSPPTTCSNEKVDTKENSSTSDHSEMNDPVVATRQTKRNMKTPELANHEDCEESQIQSMVSISREECSNAINEETNDAAKENNTTIEILDSDSDGDGKRKPVASSSGLPSSSSTERKGDEEVTNESSSRSLPPKEMNCPVAAATRAKRNIYTQETTNYQENSEESQIQTMISMGFKREECTKAMNEAECDAALAVNILLNKR